MKWVLCFIYGHLWTAKGPLAGDYCARCGQWDSER